MKASMHFDTLTYANKLKAAGMEPKLAEAQALALVEAIDEGMATKSDISLLKTEISQLRAEVKAEISQQKSELIQWMVGLFISNITLVGIFIAFSQFLTHSH